MKPIPYIPLPLIPLKLPPVQSNRPAPIWPLDTAEERLKRALREDNRTHLKRMFG